MVSLILMTAIGTPASYLLSMKQDEKMSVIIMFSIRAIMVFLAAMINTLILYRSYAAEKETTNALSNNGIDHAINDSDSRTEDNATIAEPVRRYQFFSGGIPCAETDLTSTENTVLQQSQG